MTEYKPDQVRDHSFDGIEEFDNRLPNWWLMILYGSIVFAVGYWLVFHTFKIVDLPTAKYEKVMVAAAEAELARLAAGGMNDAALWAMADLPSHVDEGRQLFTTYCVVCHADQGQGLVGPNLTDAYWIHDASPTGVMTTITDGVLEKGMQAWGNQLGPTRVQKLTAFVLSIRDTNVPGKPPEGELYEKPTDAPEPETVPAAETADAQAADHG